MADQKAQLLEQLRDIHLPEPSSWWPLALGWWLVIGLFLLIAILGILFYIYQKQRARFARLALIELTRIEENDPAWLIKLHQIMRRVSLCYFDKSLLTNLDVTGWINFLSTTGQQVWSTESLSLLRDATYKDPSTIPDALRNKLFSEVNQWLIQLPTKVDDNKLHSKESKSV